MTTKLPAPNMRGFFRPTVSRTRVMKLPVYRGMVSILSPTSWGVTYIRTRCS